MLLEHDAENDIYEVLVNLSTSNRTNFYNRLRHDLKLPENIRLFEPDSNSRQYLRCTKRAVNRKNYGVQGFNAVAYYAQKEWFEKILHAAEMTVEKFKNLGRVITSTTHPNYKKILNESKQAGTSCQPTGTGSYKPQDEEKFIAHVQSPKHFNMGFEEKYHYRIPVDLKFIPLKPKRERDKASYKQILMEWADTLYDFTINKKTKREKQPMQYFCEKFTKKLENLQRRLTNLRKRSASVGASVSPRADSPALLLGRSLSPALNRSASSSASLQPAEDVTPSMLSQSAASATGASSRGARQSYQYPSRSRLEELYYELFLHLRYLIFLLDQNISSYISFVSSSLKNMTVKKSITVDIIQNLRFP